MQIVLEKNHTTQIIIRYVIGCVYFLHSITCGKYSSSVEVYMMARQHWFVAGVIIKL